MALFDEVLEASHRRETKAEIVEYYQEQYTGRGAAGWKQQLIQDLLGIRGITREDAEYSRAAKNMARRFDPSRINNPEPRNAEEYRLLGESLPPEPPESGYHIYGTVCVKYSDDPCEPREVDEYITGEAAIRLAAMAEDEMMQAAANAYQSQEGDIDHKGPGWCSGDDCEAELHAEPIEE